MSAVPGTQDRKIGIATWVALFLALFGIIIARQIVSYFSPTLTLAAAIWKELLAWLCAIAVIILIQKGERLPLSSVGIGTSKWWKSILWSLALGAVCFLVAGAIVALTHFNGGPSGAAFQKLPLWLITCIVIRAGVVEELFYRGYALERLTAIGLHRFWAIAIALIIFSLAHWTGGVANIALAFVLGAILTAFYLWRRDLVANMIAHFLVDFVANVVPRLFS
jgi:uncharacterized protein